MRGESSQKTVMDGSAKIAINISREMFVVILSRNEAQTHITLRHKYLLFNLPFVIWQLKFKTALRQ